MLKSRRGRMGRILVCSVALLWAVPATAQQGPPDDQPFVAGTPLDMSPNARTYGSFRHAESVIYDATRDVYVAINQGLPNHQIENDGYVSLMNPDGTVHTLKWIGVNRNGLTLNDPRGSYIVNGLLYIADIDHVRMFDMETGHPSGSVFIEGSQLLNDLQVASDGTIYVTDTGDNQEDSWRIYKVTPDGSPSVLVQGAPLSRPNGMHFDPDGHVVVVNMGDRAVLTFSTEGELIRTEETLDTVNDGLVILPDGTKFISSLATGTIARIRPGQPAEPIATGIPTPASMAYDPVRNRLIVPQNAQNAVTIVELDETP